MNTKATERKPKIIESTVSVPRGEMPYISFGSGKKALVLIAGMSTSGLAGCAGPAEAEYRIFEEEYTVTLFDRVSPLNEGYTVPEMAEDIAEAMERLGIGNADVMGNSQGGMIAQYLAAERPGLVHALVLTSTCRRPGADARAVFSEWIGLAENNDGRGICRDYFRRVFTRPDPRLLACAEMTTTEKQCRRFGILAEACLSFDSSDILGRIRCPVLVTGAENDLVFGADAVKDLADRIGCPRYIYPGFGHDVCDAAPDHRERMLAFFRSVDGGAIAAEDVT